jgi:hypothetical protein
MSLIPWQAQAGAAVLAAGAIFAGGIRLEGWRDAEALGKEKLAHQADIASLKTQWQDRLDAEHKLLTQATADLDAERLADQIRKEKAEHDNQIETDRLRAAAVRNATDTQRVRDELAAAQAAGRPAGGSSPVQTVGAGPGCGGSGGFAACGFLDRAVAILERCSRVAGEQHAALVEAVAEWPK